MSLVPACSIKVLTEGRLALHNEYGILHSFWMVVDLQYLDWSDSWHTLQKSKFLYDFWTKSDGVFAKMQISDTFIFINHIQINSQFWKLLVLKVWFEFLFWQMVQRDRMCGRVSPDYLNVF